MSERLRGFIWPPARTVLFTLVLMMAGCATTSRDFLPEGVERGGANEILSSEIRAVEASHPSAREVIRDLRPAWLRMRRSASATSQPSGPAVFLDGIGWGGLDDLFRIRSTDIESMEFMSGLDATTIYGTGYPEGIVHVNTR